MELTLTETLVNRYEPGDKVSGVIKYDTATDQETIYDVGSYFDGYLFMRPFQYRFEAHRSAVTCRRIEYSLRRTFHATTATDVLTFHSRNPIRCDN